RGLTTLSLQSGDRFLGHRLLGLAEAPGLATLTELVIRSCDLGPEGLRQITAACPGRRLRRLRLENCHLNADAVGALVESAVVESWVERAVADIHEGVGGLRQPSRIASLLAEASRLAGLERLDLRKTDPEAGGALALAEASNLPRLRFLDLRGNELSPA